MTTQAEPVRTATLGNEIAEAEVELEQELQEIEERRKRAEAIAAALTSVRVAVLDLRKARRETSEEEVEAEIAAKGLDENDPQGSLQTQPTNQQTDRTSQDSADPDSQGRGGRSRVSRRAPR